MTKIDQFESVFKAAAKERFSYRRPEVGRALVITDLNPEAADAFAEQARTCLGTLADDVTWSVASGAELPTVDSMLERVASEEPQLIVTYRNLETAAWRLKHSLGDRLDVLTQATPHPILVLPHPDEHGDFHERRQPVKTVSVLTDHLAGDGTLASWGVRFTPAGGRLLLTHIEDEATFERYMEIISKIPELDTEQARETILVQLLKEPREYIESAKVALCSADVAVELVPIVKLGHRLADHLKIISDEGVDLVVFHTKDHDQFAMHGLAYPLAVELRHIPVLML